MAGHRPPLASSPAVTCHRRSGPTRLPTAAGCASPLPRPDARRASGEVRIPERCRRGRGAEQWRLAGGGVLSSESTEPLGTPGLGQGQERAEEAAASRSSNSPGRRRGAALSPRAALLCAGWGCHGELVRMEGPLPGVPGEGLQPQLAARLAHARGCAQISAAEGCCSPRRELNAERGRAGFQEASKAHHRPLAPPKAAEHPTCVPRPSRTPSRRPGPPRSLACHASEGPVGQCAQRLPTAPREHPAPQRHALRNLETPRVIP